MPLKKIGYNASICRNSNGTFAGTPAFIPLPRVRDYKESRAPSGTPDTSDRSVQAYSTMPNRRKYSVDFDAGWDAGPGLTALRTAFLAGGANNQSTSRIDLAVLDGPPAASASGVRGLFAVTKFSLDMSLTGDQKVSIMIQPYTNWANSGEYVQDYDDPTVSAGTPESLLAIKRGYAASINNSSHNPITAIRDWKLNLEWAIEESSDRAASFESVLMTQIKASLELNFLWDASDTNGVVLLQTAAKNNTEIELWALDGAYASSGSWGAHCSWAVTDWPKENPLTGGQKIACKLEPMGGGTVPLTFVAL